MTALVRNLKIRLLIQNRYFFLKILYLNHIICCPWCGITSLLLTGDSITGKEAYFTKGLCLSGPERFCVIQKLIATFFVQVLGARDKAGWQGYHNEFASFNRNGHLGFFHFKILYLRLWVTTWNLNSMPVIDTLHFVPFWFLNRL